MLGEMEKDNVKIDTVLLAKNERELQRVVDRSNRVCVRRKLRMIARKSKVMVFERKEVEVVDFRDPYRMTVLVAERREFFRR